MAQAKQVVRELSLLNKLGLHARPASLFAKTASKYVADITVSKGGHTSDAKSVIGLLMLAAEQGVTIVVTATGEDAEEAVNALEELIENKFGED